MIDFFFGPLCLCLIASIIKNKLSNIYYLFCYIYMYITFYYYLSFYLIYKIMRSLMVLLPPGIAFNIFLKSFHFTSIICLENLLDLNV